MKTNLFSLLICAGLLAGCSKQMPVADKIIINATVWTADPVQPITQAIAIAGDSILATGDNSEIEKYKSEDTEVIDANGSFITPGFIDSHVHFLDGGYNLASVQLRNAGSIEEFISRIAEFAKTQEPGTWIMGGDWDHTNWGGELPKREWIDSVTSDNPVAINRLDGHMMLANTAAIGAANITKDVSDIEGGTIVRDSDGELTGIFKDNAMGMIYRAVPPSSEQQNMQALNAAMNYVASHGVTSVHDMGGRPSELEVFEKASNDHQLITRIYHMYPLSRWKDLVQKIEETGKGNRWLKIGGLKGFMDGSLGSHTAAFFEPFSDSPDDSGFLINSEEDMRNWISDADSAGLHIMVHAIGDRAINSLLDIFEQVSTENGDKDRRFRIEHAQHIAPQDISRFSSLKVIASMQPYHAIDDGRWAEEVIGPERIKTTYAFKSLIENGAKVAFGSDWFVAPPIPLEGIYAAVTRRTLDEANPEGWVPEEKISVEEALKSYTINSAYAAFDEDIKGSITPGKLADLVMIDKNLFETPSEEIRNAKILLTIVGGNVVYDNR